MDWQGGIAAHERTGHPAKLEPGRMQTLQIQLIYHSTLLNFRPTNPPARMHLTHNDKFFILNYLSPIIYPVRKWPARCRFEFT
ncbi:MAG: hypothetical protein D6814_02125 [Calditrichaeota bacterium]|nr:MAG: hypothetical protein D6814_02125 [Calditrichota bacterium]